MLLHIRIYLFLINNIRDGEVPSGLQNPKYFSIHGLLIGAQINHAIRCHYVSKIIRDINLLQICNNELRDILQPRL